MEEKQQVETPHGIRTSIIWQCDEIVLGHAVSKFHERTTFSGSNHIDDVVRLHFGLKGDYRFSCQQLNRSYDLIGGHHNMMYSREFDLTVENKTLEVETFGIQFPKDLFISYTQHASDSLKRFCEHMVEGKSVMLSEEWGAIGPGIQQVIDQVINCNYTGELKKLFLLAKSIELLVLSADACEYANRKNEPFIKNKTDKEKIIAARDLINERVSSPPNLSEIARTVGLNEYKLKRGFKETFNTTVFGYLTDQRLSLAHQHLRDSDKTAAEVSFELGYSSPQHFATAFRKKFGFTPSSIRNNP